MRIEQMDKDQRLIWEEYDPDKVRKALTKSAGAFRDVNSLDLLRDIHQAREQDSRGRPAS